MSALKKTGHILKSLAGPLRNGGLLMVSLGFILLAHSVQIWIWAAAFVASGTLPDWNTSVYYSLITYTTLGYGDVVLGPGLRIFGGFAAINGVLGFGISTAFLVAIMGQALRDAPVMHNPDGQD